MSDAAVWWHAANGQPPTGPYTEDQLRKAQADGSIGAGGRTWSSRDGQWSSAGDVPDKPAAGRGSSGGFGFWVMLALVTLLYWLTLPILIDLAFVQGEEALDASDMVLVWPLVGFTMVVASIAGAAFWWAAAGRLRRTAELGGVIRIGAMLLLLAGGLCAFIELRQTDVAVRGAIAMSRWTYTMSVDPTGHRLTVHGSVGPRFGAAVEQHLAQMKDPITVEITSPGGLVRDAMQGAKAIEARPGSTVVVPRFCASACLIVMMGGQNRLADPGGVLGFHALAPLVKTSDQLTNWATEKQGKQAEAYMLQRGVPNDVLQRTDRIGPSRLNIVNAPDALKRGILTGLTKPAPNASVVLGDDDDQ